MKKTLVVYHSRTGHTRRVARALAGRLDADLEEVETRTAAPGVLGWVRSGIEAVAGVEPPIRQGRHDPSHYRLVVIGAPVWMGRLPGPLRSWVREHPLNGAQVAFFCTEGRTGDARLFAQLRSLCKQRPLATMAVTEAQLEADLDPVLDRFATTLAQAL